MIVTLDHQSSCSSLFHTKDNQEDNNNEKDNSSDNNSHNESNSDIDWDRNWRSGGSVSVDGQVAVGIISNKVLIRAIHGLNVTVEIVEFLVSGSAVVVIDLGSVAVSLSSDDEVRGWADCENGGGIGGV